jgi:hypothetical protein
MKKITMLIFAFVGIIATVEAQFIQQNSSVYGSRSNGVELEQKATASLEQLLERLESAESQEGRDVQQFSPNERQVLNAYFNSQNNGNRGPQATLLTEDFDDITTLPGAGFTFVNASDAVGLTDWFQGNDAVFPAQSGAPTAYIGANFNNTAGSVINNFMITPVLNLENGDEIIFWTRTASGSNFPDRLEVRISPDGANVDPTGPADVGSYTELLLEVNPGLVVGGYPDVWTQYTVAITGLTGATDTRVAFRYWVTDAGPAGNNSDYIGIDSLTIEEGAGGGGGDPTVYAANLRSTCGLDFGSFPLPGPYTLTPIAPNSSSIYGGDFDGSGTLFAFNGTTSTLLSIDEVTGAETSIGAITGLLPAETLRGMAWNEVDDMMYILAGNGDVGSIYTIDLTSGAATLVGSSTIAGWVPIWLAIDGSGNAFMADVGLDNLYSVDLTTGTATLVGALGININFAQDADFDPDTDTLYMAAYIGGGVNVFASVDTTTGVATSLGSVNADCAELGLVAIKGTGGGGGGGCPIVSDCNLIDTTPDDATSPNIWDRPFADGTCCSGLGPVSYDVYGPFTVDVTGLYTIDSDQDGGAWDGYIFLYETCFDPLDQTTNFVAGDDDGPGGLGTSQILDVNLTAGTEYYLITTGFSAGDFGDFENTITGVGTASCGGPGVTYDDCAGAIALSCGDSVVGETLTATDSGGNAAPDVFYKFTGSGTPQLVTISLCGGGTDYDSVLRVFDDCDLLNELAFNDDSCGLQSEVSFTSDGTSTYYIMVEGWGSGAGNFSLDVSCQDPLPNDDCSGAIAVSCGDTVTGSTVGATIDSGAPTCGPAITSPGVWYSFNDDSGLPGDITISLCNGTDFDSKLSIYSGSCGALVCVGGNDDACGLQSEVTFASDGNTQYYILIHSFAGATGNFTLDVTCMPTPPPNDMIANSIDVDEIGFPYTDPAVAMPAATTENGNPQGCDLTGANGVWYNFVSGGDGQANAMIVTPGGASSVTFYTAPDENATETDLVLVPQNTNQCAPGTSASIYTLAGQAYYVFVLNNGAITDIVIDGTNLGVSDNTIAGFSYYPNPTNGILNLKSVDNIEHVSLYNLLGQLVVDNRVDATASQIDISGFSTGTYLMKVTVNGQTGTYKVLKD